MKRLRDVATLVSENVRYEGGMVIVDFTLRATHAMRGKDAETATAAMLKDFRKILAMNGCTNYAWPPKTCEVIPHSDFKGFKGQVATFAQSPSIGAAILNS